MNQETKKAEQPEEKSEAVELTDKDLEQVAGGASMTRGVEKNKCTAVSGV